MCLTCKEVGDLENQTTEIGLAVLPKKVVAKVTLRLNITYP